MKYTKQQIDKKFSDSYWEHKYVKILSIETDSPELIKTAMNLVSSEDGVAKVSRLFQDKQQHVVVSNRASTSVTQTRLKSSISPPTPGAIPAFSRDPFFITGQFAGGGLLEGSATHLFFTSGSLLAVGGLEGSALHKFMASGDFTGIGTLAGAPIAYFYTSGSFAGAGTLAGGGYIQYQTSGSFSGAGTLAGDAQLLTTFWSSGSFSGNGSLAGNAIQNYLASGDFVGAGSLAGNAIQNYLASGDFVGAGSLGASAIHEFLPTVSLNGAGGLAGDATLVEPTPQVRSVSTGADDTGTTRSVTLPATIEAGDLLVLVVAYDEAGAGLPSTLTGPSGWYTRANNSVGSTLRCGVYLKEADGTEDGTTVTFTDGATAPNDFSYVCYAISGASGLGSFALRTGTGTGANIAVDEARVAWGDDNYLWICGAGSRNWGSNPTLTVTAPAGYSTPDVGGTLTNGGGCYVTLMHREKSGAGSDTEDPANITVANSDNGGTIYNLELLMCVAPAASLVTAPTTLDYLWSATLNIDGYTDGQVMDPWTDEIGSVALSAFGGNTGPLWTEDTNQTGYHAASFDGVDEAVRNLSSPSVSQPYTAFFLVNVYGNTGTDYISDGGSASNDFGLSTDGTTWSFSAGTPVDSGQSISGVSMIVLEVNGASSNAWKVSQRIGGGFDPVQVVLTSVDFGSESMAGIVLGALAADSAHSSLYVYALAIAGGTLSDAERRTAISYLARIHNWPTL